MKGAFEMFAVAILAGLATMAVIAFSPPTPGMSTRLTLIGGKRGGEGALAGVLRGAARARDCAPAGGAGTDAGHGLYAASGRLRRDASLAWATADAV